MSKVISIINWKGGVGKTTLTHHIGVEIQNAARDESKYSETGGFPRTLLVDLDPQCNLSVSCLGEDEFERKVWGEAKRSKLSRKIKTVKDLFELYLENKLEEVDSNLFVLNEAVRSDKGSIYKYVDLLPSHPDLIYTDMDIAVFSKAGFRNNLMKSEIYKFQIVHTFIQKLREKYEFILIDCPPNLNYITQNALYESDYYLIPTILDKLSSYGILSIKNKVDELNKMFATSIGDNYNPTELAGIVANNVREYDGIPKQTQSNILNSLKKTFGKKIFKNYLTNGDGMPRALEIGCPVFALETNSLDNAWKQSTMLRKITKELFDRIA